jgi:hypothetical protein
MRRWWPAILAPVVGLGLLAGCDSSSVSTSASAQPIDKPLDGELIVFVRKPGSNESTRVDEAGALPVRDGWVMHLEAYFNQPACAYLVWLNCEGQAMPLYPWNYNKLDVTDINEPAPVRIPIKVVFSPPLATSWKFGKRGGLETVLLLARRTALPEGTRLGSLIKPLPNTKMRSREELAVLGATRGVDGVSTLLAKNRGPDDEAKRVDEPLAALLLGLRDQFELIRAVRFAHDGD